MTAISFPACLLVVVLAGCAGPMPLTHDADRTQAIVTVQWANYDEIRRLCGDTKSLACTLNMQLIVTRKPRDWGDESALYALGHELFHLLGARHE